MTDTPTAGRILLSDAAALAAAHVTREGRSAHSDMFLWDRDLVGLGLRLKPGAEAGKKDRKVWVFQYRGGDGRSHRAGLGAFAKVSASAARKAAKAAETSARGGGDPIDAKRVTRQEPTIGALLDLWLKSCARRVEAAENADNQDTSAMTAAVVRRGSKRGEGPMSRSTLDGYESKIRAHFRPAFGNLKARAFTRAEILRWRDTATNAKGEPLSEGTLNTILRIASAFATWALDRGHIGANPTTGLGQFAVIERGNPLSRDEVAAVMRVLDTRRASDPIHVAAIRFLFASGARLHEALRLRWEDVNAERGEIVIHRHKTARTSGLKTLPLSDAMRRVIEDVKPYRVVGSPYIFPSTADRRLDIVAGAVASTEVQRLMRGHLSKTAMEKFWRRCLKDAKVPHRRLHDIRHSVGFHAAQAGAGETGIAALLGHASSATTRRYIKRDPAMALPAAQAAGDLLSLATKR